MSDAVSHVPPPPPETFPPPPLPVDDDNAVMIEGTRTLVVRANTVLPPVCLRTGAGGDLVSRNVKANWTPMWTLIVFLLTIPFFFIGLPIVAIYLMAGFQVEERFTFSITRPVAHAQLGATVLMWCLGLLMAGGCVWAALLRHMELFLVVLLAGAAAMFTLYYTLFMLYTVRKIENRYIWIELRSAQVRDAVYAAYLASRGGMR
jgi:hypothetical protein